VKANLMHLSAMLLVLGSGVIADSRTASGRPVGTSAPERAAPLGATQAPAHVVTLLVPSLDDPSARAVVIRRPAHPGNLILVTAETTPREYLRALRALNGSRRDIGEESADELRAVIPAATRGPRFSERALGIAAAHLESLKTAQQRDIPGIGSYPAWTSRLPVLQR
jgi:hypothetical protein